MDRKRAVEAITGFKGYWDLIVIGGGATGLGTAVDAAAARLPHAAARAARLLPRAPRAAAPSWCTAGCATSGRATSRWCSRRCTSAACWRTTPPTWCATSRSSCRSTTGGKGPFYGIGLKVYDKLAGKLGIQPSKSLSRKETLERIPTLEPDGLRGGVIYYDGQFDDSRLAIDLAQTAADHGGTVVNYMPGDGSAQDRRHGLRGRRRATSKPARSTRFTAGWWSTPPACSPTRCSGWTIPDPTPIITPSQGTHLVLDASFLPGETPPSWCPTPPTAGCCSRCRGTDAWWWAPPTSRCPSRPSSPAACPRRSTSSWRTPPATWPTIRRAPTS